MAHREGRLFEYAVGLAVFVATGFLPSRVRLYGFGAMAAMFAVWIVRDNIRTRHVLREHLAQIEARKWAHRRGASAPPPILPEA